MGTVTEKELLQWMSAYNEKYIIPNKRKFTEIYKRIDEFRKLDPRKDLYRAGRKGGSSYIRKLCDEAFMGTHVGAMYSNLPKFLDNTKKELYYNYWDEVRQNKSSDAVLGSYFKREKLSGMRTVLIQTLALFRIDQFLPIYNNDDLIGFVRDMEEALGVKGLQVDTSDDSQFLFSVNRHLFALLTRLKSKCEKIQDWTGIEFSYFLYSHYPFEQFKHFKELPLLIEYFSQTEDFVRAVFLSIYRKIGFKAVIQNQDFFPDLEMRNEDGTIERIELEYFLSGFKHPVDGWDMIVAWENDGSIHIEDAGGELTTVLIKSEQIIGPEPGKFYKTFSFKFQGHTYTKKLIPLQDLCAPSTELYRRVKS